MRALTALIALAVLSFASLPASAREHRGWHHHHRGYAVRYTHIARHTSPIYVYDFEPGVVVRAYWIPPWRNRHYFPATGEKPESGRLEDLTASTPMPEPAENFQRSWSTAPNFFDDEARANAPRLIQAPDARADERNQDQRVKP